MSPIFKDEAKFDPSERAEGILDYVLDETSEITQEEKAKEVFVDDALRSETILEEESNRMKSRVLFITNNDSALEESSQIQLHFKMLGEVFDEVHVMILGQKKRNTDTVRLSQNVWVYPTVSKSFLRIPFDAFSCAKRQLYFTDGFRADIVVTLDPFESGISGYFIAKKFKRAFQVQITEDFYKEEFASAHKSNAWRLRFAKYTLKRTKSVRVDTDALKQKIATKHSKIKDLALLPRYFNVKEIMDRKYSESISKLYTQFSFTILYIGTLGQDSTLFRALDAVRRLLQTPTIGFVVIGEGSSKAEFQKRAQLLGIASQVIFVPKVEDVIAHMHATNILVCTDTDAESEETIIKAAAVGLPMVMSRTTLREDLFTDGIDSFLCEPNNTQEFSQKLLSFLNTNALRTQFMENAREVVATRIEEDPNLHRIALRDSIESVLYLDQPSTKNKQALSSSTSSPTNSTNSTTIPDQIVVDGVEMKMPKQREDKLS